MDSSRNDCVYDFSKIKNNYDKPLSVKEIVEYVGETSIYSHYLGYLPECRRKYHSCFQQEKTPSMAFEYRDGKLLFKDFSSGNTGDCINLVEQLFNLDCKSALAKIIKDLNISSNENRQIRSTINPQKPQQKIDSELHVVLQPWSERDFAYWKQFNITDYLLDLYNVKPTKEVYYNRQLLWTYTENNPIYRYLINNKYKIYRPLAPKKYKWWGNGDSNTIFGLNQLDSSNSSICFITSSGKDVMNLKSIGYEAIAMGGETYRIPKLLIEKLKQQFDHVILFLNNDQPGINWSTLMSKELQIPNIYIPVEFTQKDPSDYCKDFGHKNEKELINTLIKNIC